MAWKSTSLRVKKCFLLCLIFLSTFLNSFAQTSSPAEGKGGPILVISSSANPFSRYTVEILRAEGFNEFDALDVSQVTATVLQKYDVVLLGEMPVTSALVSQLSTWTNAGGLLIAFKPDAKLAPLFGYSIAAGNLQDKYLLVRTNSGPGTGIVNQTIQFHGVADLYKMSTATPIATLYSDATLSTIYPAVTTVNVGTSGGKAVAFSYDLPKSIIYTRQGNPAWAGQKRDGTTGPIRSDDMFFGTNGQAHWVDVNKVAIPQADEQQHLLANIILQGIMHRKPLPRFWFLPRGNKAAIIMTGDDHNSNGTEGRFNLHKTQGPNSAQDVADWKAIRASSYVFNGTPITNEAATALVKDGFEIGVHFNTGCANFDESSYRYTLNSQRVALQQQLPGVPFPVTNRNHCIVWSDWATAAKVEADFGIRLDVNYYYWPAAFVQNRPGMFTGSGMPMRFADLDGSLIDCYQVATQMTDESGINYTTFTEQLLNKALGAEGYYGVFCANMHTDSASHIGANSIVAVAKAKQVPVISAKQMLDWLDARNNSSFDSLSFNSNQLVFTLDRDAAANGLRAMLPVYSADGRLVSISANGKPVSFYTETIKGIEYAFFDAAVSGKYVANYGEDLTAPVISNITATPNTDGTATIKWTTNETSSSKVEYGTGPSTLGTIVSDNNQVTSHNIILNNLQPGYTYYFRVTSSDVVSNSTTAPAAPAAPLKFTMPAGPCFSDITLADFKAGEADANVITTSSDDGALILKPLLNEDFSGTTVPTGWTSAAFNPGATTVADGSVNVNGTHIYSNASYAPGTTLEFVATFNQGSFQNVGFSIDQPFDGSPWVVVGQKEVDGKLYARASNGELVNLGSNLFGTPHKFKIKWNASNFEFFIDDNDVPVAKLNIVIGGNMFVQISDVFNNDGSLSVDWIRAAPYATSGNFVSRVFDGSSKKTWGAVSWSADTTAQTHVDVFVRTGNTPVPDQTWIAYTNINAPGVSVGRTSRYIQYKVQLTSENNAETPVFNDITISCTGSNTAVPTVLKQPASVAVCAGSAANFSSVAEGLPEPTVQWQQSADGTNWTNVVGATAGSFTFTPVVADNNKKYRAVWTNSEGTVNSNVVVLTVNSAPVLTSATTATATSDVSFTYNATSATAGTIFTWTRAAVTGISNAAGTGSGSVNETLINTTSAPVVVTYKYTLKANNCTGVQDVLVTVNPKAQPNGCLYTTSIAANFNSLNISAGRYIWFNGIFKATNLGSGPVNFTVSNARISYTLNNQQVNLALPDAHILFSNAVRTASTDYVDAIWETEVPLNTTANVFLTGLSYKLPSNIPGSLKNVTFSGDVRVDRQNVGFTWKWTAGVYAAFAGNSGLNVKPVDGLLNLLNPLLGIASAGTPTNYALNVIPGAMGAGLLNIVSTYSSSATPICTPAVIPVVTGRSSQEAGPSRGSITAEAAGDATGLNVRVTPNPSSNVFAVSVAASGKEPVSIRITDLVGRVVERKDNIVANSVLQMGQTWKAGTYFAEITQGTQRKVVKIMKIN